MCSNNVLFISFFLFVATSVEFCSSACSERADSGSPRLRKYNVDRGSITVSGISNGGAFATQLSFIYSSLIRGAGIFAASPYPMVYLLSKPVTNVNPILDLSPYYPLIDEWSANGGIDSTENLKGFKAYVFLGMRDRVIHQQIVRNVAAQFAHYSADVKDMTRSGVNCGHCMPTRNEINNNFRTGRVQGICNVGFAGIFDMFAYFYGDAYVEPEGASSQLTGQLFRVNLAEFFPWCNPEINSMNGTAWMYVPEACDRENKQATTTTKCHLHLAFHGYQLPWRARFANDHNAFVEDAGYLQVADTNNVILLFPEALWRGYDIIGFTGPETFVLKTGTNNLAIKKMIDRITLGI